MKLQAVSKYYFKLTKLTITLMDVSRNLKIKHINSTCDVVYSCCVHTSVV